MERTSVSSIDIKLEGMHPSFMLSRAGGPRVIFGTRDKGTSVPMIAALFDDHARTWKSDLPGTRPLETGPFPPERGAVTSDRAFTVYGLADIMKPKVLVVFDLSGHRLWETPLPDTSPLSAIEATEKRVYVAQWGRLQAYDATDGKALFAIGER